METGLWIRGALSAKTLNPHIDKGISLTTDLPSEVKVLISKLAGIPIDQIPDNHPDVMILSNISAGPSPGSGHSAGHAPAVDVSVDEVICAFTPSHSPVHLRRSAFAAAVEKY